jgi:DNA-binding Lrp family transcriptional regulator
MGMSKIETTMPYDDRDETSGRFRREFNDEQFIRAVRERDLPTTSEIAEAVGCKYRTAYDRLGRLEDDGRLSSRKIGSSLVWTAIESETEDDR